MLVEPAAAFSGRPFTTWPAACWQPNKKTPSATLPRKVAAPFHQQPSQEWLLHQVSSWLLGAVQRLHPCRCWRRKGTSRDYRSDRDWKEERSPEYHQEKYSPSATMIWSAACWPPRKGQSHLSTPSDRTFGVSIFHFCGQFFENMTNCWAPLKGVKNFSLQIQC